MYASNVCINTSKCHDWFICRTMETTEAMIVHSKYEEMVGLIKKSVP
jgi:hypothetical protein